MNRFSLSRVDLSLLIPSVLLVAISLATLFSIDATFFNRQIVSFGIGIFLYFLFLNIDYKFFSVYSKYIYGFIIIAFIVVLTFGTTINGSRSWLVLGGIRMQPEEFIKPLFVIVVAHFLAYAKYPTFLKFVLSIVLIVPIIFLILRQPDTGTALMYIGAFMGMMLMYGFPLLYYIFSVFLATIPMPFLYQMLRPYQKERLITLFNITQDPFGSSYNLIQALISIGSGGLFGKGLGEGTQSVLRFLPERQTDFIFASISENMGLLGGMSIIILLCFLLYRMYRISLMVGDNMFAYLIVIGAFFFILVQTVTNIGMNMGMVPVIGVTLPLVSYGGSSLISTFILLGIVSSIAYEHKRSRMMEIVS